MKPQKQRKPFVLYILLLLIFFQALSGLSGGTALVFDPTGGFLKMPLSLLDRSPFENYLIPGLILLILLGLFPSWVFYSLLARSQRNQLGWLNAYKEQHWSWTASLYVGVMLVIWMDFEILWIGHRDLMQTVYALAGVAIIIFTLHPAVKKHYTSIHQS